MTQEQEKTHEQKQADNKQEEKLQKEETVKTNRNKHPTLQEIVNQIVIPKFRKYTLEQLSQISQPAKKIGPSFNRSYYEIQRNQEVQISNRARGYDSISQLALKIEQKKYKALPAVKSLQNLSPASSSASAKNTEEKQFEKSKQQQLEQVQQTPGAAIIDVLDQSMLLKYYKFSELNIIRSLQEHAILYIENWINLKDHSFYQNLVLDAVRWLYIMSLGVERAQTMHQSHFQKLHKSHYLAFKRIDKVYNNTMAKNQSCSRIPCMDQISQSIAAAKSKSTFSTATSDIIKRQQRTRTGVKSLVKFNQGLKQDIIRKSGSDWTLKTNNGTTNIDGKTPSLLSSGLDSITSKNLQYLLSPDWRKKELMRGSGNITRQAIASIEPVTSTYTATFTTQPQTLKSYKVNRDVQGSFSVGGISPQPMTLRKNYPKPLSSSVSKAFHLTKSILDKFIEQKHRNKIFDENLNQYERTKY